MPSFFYIYDMKKIVMVLQVDLRTHEVLQNVDLCERSRGSEDEASPPVGSVGGKN